MKKLKLRSNVESRVKCRSWSKRWYYIRKAAMEFWNVELAVRRYSMPLGVATYRTSEDMPPAYKAIKPLLEGSQKLLAEMNAEVAAKPKPKGKWIAK